MVDSMPQAAAPPGEAPSVHGAGAAPGGTGADAAWADEARRRLLAGDDEGVLALDGGRTPGGEVARLMGLAALRQGRAAEAEAFFEAARADLGAADVGLTVALGGTALAAGDLETAEARFRAAQAEAPHAAAAAVGLAETLTRRGDADGAVAAWRHAVGALSTAAPARFDSWMLSLPADVGVAPMLSVTRALAASPARDQAAFLARRVLTVAPGNAAARALWDALRAPADAPPDAPPDAPTDAPTDAPVNAGAETAAGIETQTGPAATRTTDDTSPALAETDATTDDATAATLLTLRAEVLCQAERAEDAAAAARAAIDRDPAAAAPWHALATALEALGAEDEAIAAHLAAVLRAPTDPAGHQGLARALERRNLLDSAVERWGLAVAADPEGPDGHLGLAEALLKGGVYRDGWDEHEWRVLHTDRPAGSFAQPAWSGEPLGGGRLLVWRERQDLAEEVLALRLAPAAARATGGALLLEVAPALVTACARAFPDAVVIPAADPPHPETRAEDVVSQVPVGSLARLLGGEPSALVGDGPTLEADPARVAALSDALRKDGPETLLVGLAWRAGPLGAEDSPGACPEAPDWADWRPLFSVPGVRVVPLQAGTEATADLARLRDDHDIALTLEPALAARTDGAAAGEGEDAIEALLALVDAMDAVVTVDSTVAHLAGALSVPGIVLLPFAASWPWGMAGTRTPWYPSLRLARQVAPGAWRAPVGRAAQALARFRADAPSGADS